MCSISALRGKWTRSCWKDETLHTQRLIKLPPTFRCTVLFLTAGKSQHWTPQWMAKSKIKTQLSYLRCNTSEDKWKKELAWHFQGTDTNCKTLRKRWRCRKFVRLLTLTELPLNIYKEPSRRAHNAIAAVGSLLSDSLFNYYFTTLHTYGVNGPHLMLYVM